MKQSFEGDIEEFAGLMARLDDPFADQTAVLANASLDERAHEELASTWRERLGGASSSELGERFAAAYAIERAALIEQQRAAAYGRPPRSPDERPEPTSPKKHPVAPAGAAAARAEIFAETADITSFVPKVALPFTPSSAAPPRAALSSTAPLPRIGTGTANVDTSAFKPRSPLPFPSSAAPGADPRDRAPPALAPLRALSTALSPAPKAASAPAPPAPPAAPAVPAPPAGEIVPGRRLIRFDPQTGEPLREPRWIDAPTSADGPPKGTKK